MMNMSFSKADNKVARKLFEVALQRELKKRNAGILRNFKPMEKTTA
jgi:hypothetical protein